jgi:hypothetical protein
MVAKAKIFSGICGFTTQVDAVTEGRVCKVSIESECKAITKMAADLTEVDPFQEISFKRGMPHIHEKGHEYCTHAACPVPVGIIKAVEVASGLALPKDASIEISE